MPLKRRQIAWRAAQDLADGAYVNLGIGLPTLVSDFIPAERRFPDRVGEIYQLEYSSLHRWYYFPRMRRDEALVFKVYDSATDGRSRFSAHTSFEDPTSPAGAPTRESIEIRAFAFF